MEDIQPGCRVVVPFGRKKYYTAIVCNVHYCPPEGYEVKEITTVLDTSPVLLPFQFKFWEWLADYYLCTQGDVYKAALPSGLKLESETIVEYNFTGTGAKRYAVGEGEWHKEYSDCH